MNDKDDADGYLLDPVDDTVVKEFVSVLINDVENWDNREEERKNKDLKSLVYRKHRIQFTYRPWTIPHQRKCKPLWP